MLKEIVEPLGAKLQVRNILSGDPSLSVLELWGAEYQENCGDCSQRHQPQLPYTSLLYTSLLLGECNPTHPHRANPSPRLPLSPTLALSTQHPTLPALLLRPESLPLFKTICARENCPASFVGQVQPGLGLG